MGCFFNNEQSPKRASFLCTEEQCRKNSFALKYACDAYIYQPSTVAKMELNSGQCLLLSLIHGLVTDDITFCTALASVSFSLQQLRSSYLRVWLKDDFSFKPQDIERALTLLSELVVSGRIELPIYVIDTLAVLAAKYGVPALSFTPRSQSWPSSLERQLQLAVTKNNVADITALTMKGADINGKTDSGDSLLHLAVRSGCVESIATLGYLKVETELRDSAMLTPLQRAVVEDNGPVVRALLLIRANANRRSFGGDTLLHLAAARSSNAALNALLEGGVSVHEKNHAGETALIKAIIAHNATGVKALVARDSGVLATEGYKLLETAVLLQSLPVTIALMEGGAQTDFLSETGESLLHMAITAGNEDIANALIEGGAPLDLKNKDGLEPLHVCSNVRLIKKLISRGVPVDSKTTYGKTALHLAATNGSTELVVYLIQLGAEVEAKDSNGNSSLSLAAAKFHIDIVMFLLSEGADPNTKNNNGLSPLHQAALEGCLEIVEVLVNAKAVVNAEDNHGLTAACNAAAYGKLSVLQYLVTKGADIYHIMEGGTTMIHIAAYKGEFAVLSWLLDIGVSLEVKGEENFTPLHWGVAGGNVDIITFLLDRGSNIHALTADNSTNLHIAASEGHLEVVQLLLERGLNINSTNDSKETPLSLAIGNKHKDVENFLRSEGATSNKDL